MAKRKKRGKRTGGTYLTPGVYVDEVSSGSRPIEAVGTAVAAFVGLARRRPVRAVVTVIAALVAVIGAVRAARH
jgi:phage tail sheath protein FI